MRIPSECYHVALSTPRLRQYSLCFMPLFTNSAYYPYVSSHPSKPNRVFFLSRKH
jgi:hypothetical protein